MKNKTISRRDLLKGTGALVVSFSLWSPLSRAFADVQDVGDPRREAF